LLGRKEPEHSQVAVAAETVVAAETEAVEKTDSVDLQQYHQHHFLLAVAVAVAAAVAAVLEVPFVSVRKPGLCRRSLSRQSLGISWDSSLPDCR
jgi:hypothetical protein